MRKIFLLVILFLLASCGRDAEDYSETEYTPVFAGTAEVAEIPAQEETPTEEPPTLREEPATPESPQEPAYFTFENYVSIGYASDEFLDAFEQVRTVWASIEDGADIAIWATDAPLYGFEVVRILTALCDCCGDFYFVPSDTMLGFSSNSSLPLEYAVVIRNYISRSNIVPTNAVTFYDSTGTRRYLAIFANFARTYSEDPPFVLVEFALDFDLDNGVTLPWAFPPNCTRPRYVYIGPRRYRTGITYFDSWGSGLNNEALLPFRYMSNLESAMLAEGSFCDISPLAGLTNLVTLELRDTNVTDLTPLANLTNLTRLGLGFIGGITDISPLAGLTNLTQIDLTANQISDVTPLAGLENLTWLRLCNNEIRDISPLDGLSDLQLIADYNPFPRAITKRIHPDLPEFTFYHTFAQRDGEEFTSITIVDEYGNLIQEVHDIHVFISGAGVQFDDYNFDGFLDMRLEYDNSGWIPLQQENPWQANLFWLWDSEISQFVPNAQLQELTRGTYHLTRDNRIIVTWYRNWLAQISTYYYEYIGGEILLTEQTEEESFDGSWKFTRTNILTGEVAIRFLE